MKRKPDVLLASIYVQHARAEIASAERILSLSPELGVERCMRTAAYRITRADNNAAAARATLKGRR